ncbi:hypothetical protein [Nocardioides sp. URHA0020]|uniref:hypothetical protein n=1 Tax=Nocardioides sp. URHA0020 TaxID=1380392 RepID=UPI00068566D2|nr:hypothetical protein [Nocardioides sp. URHA0020]
MSKSSLLIGVGIGYVLGSRAGRERYEQIRSGASKVAHNPTVQTAAGRAQEAVGHQAAAVADAAKEKVVAATHRS